MNMILTEYSQELKVTNNEIDIRSEYREGVKIFLGDMSFFSVLSPLWAGGGGVRA